MHQLCSLTATYTRAHCVSGGDGGYMGFRSHEFREVKNVYVNRLYFKLDVSCGPRVPTLRPTYRFSGAVAVDGVLDSPSATVATTDPPKSRRRIIYVRCITYPYAFSGFRPSTRRGGRGIQTVTDIV